MDSFSLISFLLFFFFFYSLFYFGSRIWGSTVWSRVCLLQELPLSLRRRTGWDSPAEPEVGAGCVLSLKGEDGRDHEAAAFSSSAHQDKEEKVTWTQALLEIKLT